MIRDPDVLSPRVCHTLLQRLVIMVIMLVDFEEVAFIVVAVVAVVVIWSMCGWCQLTEVDVPKNS